MGKQAFLFGYKFSVGFPNNRENPHLGSKSKSYSNKMLVIENRYQIKMRDIHTYQLDVGGFRCHFIVNIPLICDFIWICIRFAPQPNRTINWNTAIFISPSDNNNSYFWRIFYLYNHLNFGINNQIVL